MARDLAYWEAAVKGSKARYDSSVRRAGPSGKPNPILLRNYMLNLEQLAAFKSGRAIPQYDAKAARAATDIGRLMSRGVSPSYILSSGAPVGSFDGVAPPLPHPDASDQSLGPNVGGADGVSLPGDTLAASTTGAVQPPSGGGGLLVFFGGLALLLLLLNKKK